MWEQTMPFVYLFSGLTANYAAAPYKMGHSELLGYLLWLFFKIFFCVEMY
jgi:hypothetical protein